MERPSTSLCLVEGAGRADSLVRDLTSSTIRSMVPDLRTDTEKKRVGRRDGRGEEEGDGEEGRGQSERERIEGRSGSGNPSLLGRCGDITGAYGAGGGRRERERETEAGNQREELHRRTPPSSLKVSSDRTTFRPTLHQLLLPRVAGGGRGRGWEGPWTFRFQWRVGVGVAPDEAPAGSFPHAPNPASLHLLGVGGGHAPPRRRRDRDTKHARVE